MRLLLSLCAVKAWVPNVIDATTAVLQRRPIERNVYLKTPKAAMENPNTVWKRHVTMYILADAQKAWFKTVKDFFLSIGKKQLIREPAVFVWFEGGLLKGFVSTHIDDFLWSGDRTFESNTIEQLQNRFPIGEETRGDFVHVGVRIRTILDGGGNLTEILMDQEDYVEEIKEAEFNRDLKDDVLLG